VLVVQRFFRAKRTNLHEKYDYPAVCAAGWLDPDERVSGGIDLDAWCVATSVRQGSSMKIEEATWSKPLADLQTRV
jgi:hypothetical protein